jgi:hypothetical protein
MTEDKTKWVQFGWLSGFGMLITVVGLGVAALSALGVIFGFQLSIGDAPLPNDWESVIMTTIAIGLIGLLSVYGAFMKTRFKAAKGKPAVRLGLVVIGLGLLFLAFLGLQRLALVSTYGSMLAYYATDGDLEDVKAELAKNPKPEHLAEGVSRAAQYGNVEALKLLLAAGADFSDIGAAKEEYRSCALGGSKVGIEFVKVALAHGAKPDNCPNSQDLIYDKVRQRRDDAETAQIVTALRGAGWSPLIKPDYSKRTALEVAKEKKLTATIAALQ